MHINLFVAKSPSPPPEEAGKWKGWGRCVVFVDDVYALHASLTEQGVQAPAPQDAPWGERCACPNLSPSSLSLRAIRCIHIYIHACMHAYIHACMRAFIHTYLHARMHTYIQTDRQTNIQTYITEASRMSRFFHVLDPDGHELSFATPDYRHPRWQ